MQSVRQLLKLARESWPLLAGVAFANLLVSGANTIRPYFLKEIIDVVTRNLGSGSMDPASLAGPLIWLFVVSMGIAAGYAVVGLFSEKVFFIVFTQLRIVVLEHLSRLSLPYFEQNRVGEIMEKFRAGTGEFVSWLYGVIESALSNTLTTIFILVLLLLKFPLVGLVVTASVVINILILLKTLGRTSQLRKQGQQLQEQAGGEATELLTHIATVRSFSSESILLKRYRKLQRQFKTVQYQRIRLFRGRNLLRALVDNLAMVAGIAIVGFSVAGGQYSAGDIVLVSLYLQQVSGSVRPITIMIQRSVEIETIASRLMGLLAIEATVVDRPKATKLKNIENIELDAVSFTYPNKLKPAIADISFQVKRGEMVALVGASGVGKTTLTKLLLRFYDPDTGALLVNGTNFKEFSQNSLRSRMGLVMQDLALFNATIEENIGFAKPEASPAEIKAAAKLAHADIFISKLPDKYQTLVGERGIKLSGGERQRVAIARAILKNPDLIILDEATSSLDSESEQHVQAGLSQLLKDRTAVVIAHRLSTVMQADQILVMKHGRIVETGKHAELIKQKGTYARLFELQSQGRRVL